MRVAAAAEGDVFEVAEEAWGGGGGWVQEEARVIAVYVDGTRFAGLLHVRELSSRRRCPRVCHQSSASACSLNRVEGGCSLADESAQKRWVCSGPPSRGHLLRVHGRAGVLIAPKADEKQGSRCRSSTSVQSSRNVGPRRVQGICERIARST